MKRRSFLPLYATNFFGVLNDNFLKTLAGFAAMGWIADARTQSVFMGAIAGALVLPYIFLSPLADRLTALFPKRRILRMAKWAELPIMAVAIAGFVRQSPGLVVASVLLMGLQSSLYSPAKYALVRDIGGVERVSTGMGGMEGTTFIAVLAGMVACRGAHFDPTMAIALTASASAPVAAMNTMFAAKYGQDVDVSVGLVAVTTLLSIVSMPLLVGLAMSFFS